MEGGVNPQFNPPGSGPVGFRLQVGRTPLVRAAPRSASSGSQGCDGWRRAVQGTRADLGSARQVKRFLNGRAVSI